MRRRTKGKKGWGSTFDDGEDEGKEKGDLRRRRRSTHHHRVKSVEEKLEDGLGEV